LKITREGKDVTSIEPRDYVFGSAFGTVKVFKEPDNKVYETIDIPAGGSATATIAHGLPFVPLVMLFTELTPGSGHWYAGGVSLADPTDLSGAVTMDGSANSLTYVDTTNVYITYENLTGSSMTVKYYYFIFADNG
jgi:hypothetical protein